ncbi:MAG: hypothetical protein GAK29_04093 [Acinetobacter bereziniae]|uniref:Uncharacterized protein n=1 Tax=Acinetobacter bereziniae TaxID=106648 RepID=A0A833PCG5_ACIBZ|nr:MAG: hypothetical protein GAK29_04093 [Acinetobacter bereziniae]
MAQYLLFTHLRLHISYLYIQLPSCLVSSFKTCKRREENFQQCLTSAVQDALQQLNRTHPELGLPSFHPLNLTSVVVFKQGAHRVIPIENKIEYLGFHGLTNTHVLNFEYFLTIFSLIYNLSSIFF